MPEVMFNISCSVFPTVTKQWLKKMLNSLSTFARCQGLQEEFDKKLVPLGNFTYHDTADETIQAFSVNVSCQYTDEVFLVVVVYYLLCK